MFTNAQAQLRDLQKTQLDVANAYGAALLQATEKLTQLTTDSSRDFLAQGADVARTLMGAKDPQELAKLAGSLTQPQAEKLASYAREAYSIARSTGTELSRILETQVAEGNRQVIAAIDQLAKSAPAGSEQVLDLLKNAVTVASTGADTLAKAAKQAGETVEANLNAAVDYASKAAKGNAA
jgi:phasin family protein